MIGRVVAGRFELDRRAGAGGMGTVYRARDLVEGSSVAVKLLSVRDQRNADRFESEAAILAGLSHPAIVRYLSHGLTETGERYLVMEWLDGEDLATRLDREPLAMPDSLALARRIAGALEYVHPRGVVHRDIKPENLFLPEGDISRVKLLDFGIARLGGRAGGPRLTATGSVVGTPGYIAPEMIRGERVVRPAADIFSFGCVLFQCLVGRPPFDSEDTRALMAKILLQDAPRLRDVAPNMPAELDELLAAMLAKDSDQRISGGAALVEALGRLGGDLATVRPAKWRARRIALTTTEQRIVCVVMAACSSPAEPGGEATGAAPASADAADPTRPSIRVDAIVDGADAWLAAGQQAAEGSGDGAGLADVAGTIVTDTVPDPEAAARSTGLRRIEAHLDGVHGAQVDYLPDGTLLVSFTETAKPSDQAARAARSALAIRAALPDTPVVVATGPGRFSGAADHHRTEVVDLASAAPLFSMTRSGPRGRLMVGDVIENGSRLLRATAPGSIRIDDMTAGFLDGRFEIQREELAFYLRGERDLFEQQRSLLGRSTEFVGRGRELSFLTNLIASVSAECQAAAMLVTGAAGVGKSRLRREFLEWVQRQSRRIEVLFAAGDSLAAGSPFAMLGQALRRSAGIREDQSLEEKRSRFEKRIARHIPPESRRRITSFLGELARISYPDENLSALGAARGNPQLMSDGIRRAFEDFLAAECNAQPVLLVLEDLHWGDLGTVTLVDGALRALSEQPLMVLALARPEVDDTFPELWREREPQHMRLAPLSRKAAERLVREALGAEATADDVARIVSRADGNAFFLEELVRAHAAGRGGELPDSVLGMVQARLDAEGTSAKRVLRAASVFGERFTRAGVLALLGGSDGDPEEGDSQSDITDWLGRLCDRELISRPPTPVPGTDVDYTFAHALVREAAYAMLTAEDRRLGHRLAGDYLEQVGGQAGADPMILAEHFQRAEEPGRAIRWYQHAAEQALNANDLGAAVKRAELGIACGADGLRAGLLRSVQAEAHLWRGELSLAESRALEAVALLQPGTAPWLRAQGQVVVAAAKQGNFDRVELQTREVIHTLPEFGARNAEIACLAWAANFLIFGGRTAAADDLMITIGDLAGDLSDLDAEAVALVRQVRSARALAAGDLAGCLTELSIALLWFERASDLRNACAIRSNMAYVSAELGDLESAEAALRQALIAADRMGLRDVTAHVRHNLGRVLGLQGQLTEAAAVEAEAVKSFAAQGDPRLEGVARAYHAEILLASGDLTAAAAEASAAVSMLEVSPSLRVAALAVFARVRMARGETAEALVTAREAFEALARLGEIEEGEALVRLTFAECLEAAGFLDEARGVILAARARLLERASHIGEPEWRERFLRDVPANARTLALADQILTTSSGPVARAV